MLLDVQGLMVRYRSFTLGPIDLRLEPGTRIALVGANGAGKTTLLSRVAAEQLPTHGQISLGGRRYDRPTLHRRREHIGYVSDTFEAYPWMTVQKHLRFVSRFYPRWSFPRQAQLCEELELDPSQRVSELSRGNQVKLTLVSAEAHRPELLVLDEPTVGLDPLVRTRFLQLVRRELDVAPDRSLIFSTHILEDVGVLADRLVFLRDGRIASDMPTNELREGDDSMPEAILRVLSA